MKTIFLIINYNDADTTEMLIKNIINYNCLDCIVVLDNKSTDNSYTYLSQKYKTEHIHVIQSEINKGYAYGINFGCQYIEKLYGDANVIISNSDIEIRSEKDIEKLIACKKKDYAIVAPIIFTHGKIDRGWKIPSPLQDCLLNIVYIHKFLKPKLLFYKDSYYASKGLKEVEVILGCFFLIDTYYLKKVNYFDENTFLYYEENIMAKKLKDISVKTMINCDVEVIHNHSVSIDKSINKIKKYKLLKESQFYFQKEYNHANLIERFLLKFTDKMSYCILKIVYTITK